MNLRLSVKVSNGAATASRLHADSSPTVLLAHLERKCFKHPIKNDVTGDVTDAPTMSKEITAEP